MTEQQIREQTQAVFDAYLMISKNGVSLSDFLEFRREAIRELGEHSTVIGTSIQQCVPASSEPTEKQRNHMEEIRQAIHETESKDFNHSPVQTGYANKKDATPSPAAHSSNGDFLDDFRDPWN